MNLNMHASKEFPIGVLKWESGCGITLSQLEQMPGNVMHPDTFSFPVLFLEVEGACFHTIVEEPSRAILEASIRGAKALERAGVRAISASCGFWGIFQTELADAVSVPVATSSLLQVPAAARLLRRGQAVGILTASRRHLTPRHLAQAGIPAELPLFIAGIEDTPEFGRIRTDPGAVLDAVRFQGEVIQIARELLAQHPEIGTLVLECTDLPPCSPELRRVFGIPVFDYITLLDWLHTASSTQAWPLRENRQSNHRPVQTFARLGKSPELPEKA